ncbi:hypothetical protein D917_06411 [Trichinella nativa]|uniref:Uncharacterized protein n=1 Tax=Trichinella nativa TaxID=6335 RepID=A0A1Y3ESH3_9BILA|nr:hypothetical protein D917_06411 [Trichinella nativa]
MLWSPSVHLPAAVTDCHDPLDMDGSIICLLISSTGVLDSYIARLVSSSALIDEKLAANFYTVFHLNFLFSFRISYTDCVSNSAGDSTWQRLRLGYTRRPCSSHPNWHVLCILSHFFFAMLHSFMMNLSPD